MGRSSGGRKNVCDIEVYSWNPSSAPCRDESLVVLERRMRCGMSSWPKGCSERSPAWLRVGGAIEISDSSGRTDAPSISESFTVSPIASRLRSSCQLHSSVRHAYSVVPSRR